MRKVVRKKLLAFLFFLQFKKMWTCPNKPQINVFMLGVRGLLQFLEEEKSERAVSKFLRAFVFMPS